mmetsp:Transcript_78595/g.227181  ORF Transcript_78595/g.227181 Transcript_78595/m.227181 type:complete len:81 (+) Transcript_78595:123-365(+)
MRRPWASARLIEADGWLSRVAAATRDLTAPSRDAHALRSVQLSMHSPTNARGALVAMPCFGLRGRIWDNATLRSTCTTCW